MHGKGVRSYGRLADAKPAEILPQPAVAQQSLDAVQPDEAIGREVAGSKAMVPIGPGQFADSLDERPTRVETWKPEDAALPWRSRPDNSGGTESFGGRGRERERPSADDRPVSCSPALRRPRASRPRAAHLLDMWSPRVSVSSASRIWVM
jgi:hypothetical protein